MAYSLINHKFLVLFKILKVFWNLSNKLIYIWVLISIMSLNEHVLCLLRDFEESFRGHILHSWMLFMHKFIQFSDYSLKECPMRT